MCWKASGKTVESKPRKDLQRGASVYFRISWKGKGTLCLMPSRKADFRSLNRTDRAVSAVDLEEHRPDMFGNKGYLW